MAITINGSGTITGVSVGGLPDGIVDTDMLAAGAVTAAKRGAGAILQVVQTTKTDVDSMTGTTFDDLGLSVTITPSSSSSKVLIFVYASIGSLASYDMKLRLLRGTTPISVGDAAGNRAQASTSLSFSWSTGSYGAGNLGINFLDSPATTSATTYKLQAASYDPNTIIALNRGPNDTNLAAYEGRTASSMIAMEVAA